MDGCPGKKIRLGLTRNVVEFPNASILGMQYRISREIIGHSSYIKGAMGVLKPWLFFSPLASSKELSSRGGARGR